MHVENVYEVFPINDGVWRVKNHDGSQTLHLRKALAALYAKQAAANGSIDGRVIFYREDGSVEVERYFNARLKE